MSTPGFGAIGTETLRATGARFRRRVFLAVFGDRVGLSLFLGTVLFTALTWRVGVFITDNYTPANALVALAEGHLHVDRAVYGPGLDTPGMHRVDGQWFGRNYAHVVLALPILWVLEGIAALADPRIALSGLWSLGLLALAVTLGTLVDRRQLAAVGGSLVALVVFAGNAATATPLAARWFPFLALQAVTVLAAGLVSVLTYRLVARQYDRRVGVAAGLGVVLAVPVSFWATVPKRHVLTALAVVSVCYALYRSRAAQTPGGARRFRALAYVPVGLLAWLHAPEALLLLAVLGPVDLVTARSNDPRSLALVAVVFALSLIPFFVTNALISGDPLAPPRLLGRGGATGGGGGTGGGLPAPFDTALGAAQPVLVLWGLISEGLRIAIDQPDQVYRTVLRRGFVESVAAGDNNLTVNLSFLESAPVLAALAAVPLAVWRAAKRTVRTLPDRPTLAVDLLAVGYGIGLVLIYLPRLPIHAQVTVRYLLPAFPLGVYGVVRLPAVRTVIRARWRLIAWTYAAGVLVGGQMLLAWVALADAPLGEAVQVHALLGLALAAPVATWTVAAGAGWDSPTARRTGAVALGTAAAATTVFVLLAGLRYFAYAGDPLLPLIPGL